MNKMKKTLAALEHPGAFLSERDRAGGADEELPADGLLELGDEARHGGAGEGERLGRPGEAAELP